MKIETQFSIFSGEFSLRFYDYERENGDNHVSKTEKTLFRLENFSKPIEEKNDSLVFNEE